MTSQDQQSLHSFIQQSLQADITVKVIKQKLEASGWDTATVNQALQIELHRHAQISRRHAHRKRIGMAWILSPFVILIGNALLQVFMRANGIDGSIVSVISLLAGAIGIVMLLVGPIIGIIIMNRS